MMHLLLLAAAGAVRDCQGRELPIIVAGMADRAAGPPKGRPWGWGQRGKGTTAAVAIKPVVVAVAVGVRAVPGLPLPRGLAAAPGGW